MIIAIVTMQSYIGNLKKNISKINYFVKEAINKKTSIICFPEANLTGYDNISPFAISCYNKNVRKLISISNKNDITILPGFVEQDFFKRKYITHTIITPNKKIGYYRKIHISPTEKKIFNKGRSFFIFRVKKINIGIQLCYDSHFPELSSSMSQAGADIFFIPHASPYMTTKNKNHSWIKHLKARAFDNSIFIIAHNQVGSNFKKLNFPGNIIVISPSGKIIKKKLSYGEKMIFINLDLNELKLIRKHKIRYFLPNREPNQYKIIPKIAKLLKNKE